MTRQQQEVRLLAEVELLQVADADHRLAVQHALDPIAIGVVLMVAIASRRITGRLFTLKRSKPPTGKLSESFLTSLIHDLR